MSILLIHLHSCQPNSRLTLEITMVECTLIDHLASTEVAIAYLHCPRSTSMEYYCS